MMRGGRVAGLMVGLSAVAVLAGGATFAGVRVWDSGPAGVVVAGDVDVEPVGAPVWSDVSPDLPGGPAPVADVSSWLLVPGDTIRGVQPFRVDVEGDNVAVSVSVVTADGGPVTLPEGVSAVFDVVDSSGTVILEDAQVGDVSEVRFSADGEAGTVPVGVGVFDVVVDVSVDGSARNVVRVGDVVNLGGLQVMFEQVRVGGSL